MSIDKEKYKTLYEYQRLQFDQENAHYYKLEDRSGKYLTFLTIFFPIYIFLFTYFLKDIDISCIILPLLFFFLVFSIINFSWAWSYLFRSSKLMEIPKMPSDTDLIENVYYKYDLESIYLYKADLYRKGILLFKKSNDEKIRLINLAYKDIVFGSWSFVLSLITLAIIKMASI
ncbi:hypothetical protein HXZ77_04220 [Acinetobacter johnsonii]|uniref:hypothetical protein n=2 Tax=Acinetobacter johnsonii TaxID=40214 RepID=UPI002578B957|nr:hypothetical protein [Acinetobacter johnsonii]MDM1250344.1 hypothetical protein [Acinetobacter johnsonii]